MAQTFKVGDKVRFFQDLSESAIEVPDVALGSIGEVIEILPIAKTPHDRFTIRVNFGDPDAALYFKEEELELVDEEVDLPFNPLNGMTLTTVLDTSLGANQNLYLSALSGMATARKQMADLTLDRYLPTAVREALEEALEKKVVEFGQQAEDSVKRMAKILEVYLQ